MWLPNAEHVPATKPAVSYISVPYRVVLHSTQCGSIDSAVAAYAGHGGWPQITADPKTKRVAQHYDTAVGGRALRHDKGTVDTNAARAIQIEIVGYAETGWPDDQLVWLAETVLWPIVDHHGIALEAPAFLGVNDAYGTKSKTRMTEAAWLIFNGICGHQHVPSGNDHWDPGPINTEPITNRSITMATIPTWAQPSWDKAVAAKQIAAGTELDTVERYELVVLLDRLGAYDGDFNLEESDDVEGLAKAIASIKPSTVDLDALTADVVAAVLEEFRARLA